MKQKHRLNIFHVIVNASSIVEHLTRIKNGIMINDKASVKNIVQVKKIIVGILARIFVRIVAI